MEIFEVPSTLVDPICDDVGAESPFSDWKTDQETHISEKEQVQAP